MAVTATPAAEPTATEPPPSPYPGLRPFTENDAAFFYGRAAEVEIVGANLLSSRLTLVYGASGVGKTSVLLAGVANTLRRQAAANLDDEDEFNDFAVVIMTSWADPDPNAAIAAAARAEVEALLGRDDLPEPPDGATLAEVLEHWSDQLGGKLLVVFDQFEEYFRYHHDDRRAGTFDAEFPQAVNGVDVPAHFLLSVRDDELARLDHFKGRIPKLFDNRVKIDHLTCPGAERAIRRPLEKLPAEHRVGIEEELVSALLANCAVRDPALAADSVGADGRPAVVKAPTGSVKAPLLQVVLERLWRSASEAGADMLTLAQLQSLGGVEGILDTHLRTALEALTPPEQDIAAKCFGLLVSPIKTKMAYPASVLARVAGRDDEREVTAVLDRLCSGESGHILNAVDTGQDGGSKSYELSNADLLAEPIIAWQKEHDEKQRRAAEEARRLAIRRKYRNRSFVLVTLAAIFAALGAWAWVERHTAEIQKTNARSIALASTANTLLATRPDISLLLSLAAYDTKPTVEATSSMISALEAAQSSGAMAILHGHTDQVTAVAFSPDGSTLATGSWDSTVRLWDVRTHAQLGEPLIGHKGTVNSVAFSPDGHTIATASDDKTVRLWNVDTHEQRGKAFLGHTDRVNSVAFSPDGRTLASGGDDKTVRMWDVQTHTQRGKPLRGYKAAINSVAFSPDGRILATGSQETLGGTLWNVAERSRIGRYFGTGKKSGGVDGVAFSADGKTLATAGADRTVRLWDVDTQQQIGKPFSGHTDGVQSVAFSPDGRTLASGSWDKTVRLWNVATHKQRGKPLTGHREPVMSVAFSPVKRKTVLASGSFDTTVRLWDLSTPRAQLGQPLLGQQDRIVGLGFSADGRTLATGSWDNTVWLWDLNDTPPLGKPLAGEKGDLISAALSGDGHTLAIGERDGTVQLWNVGKRKPFGRRLLGHEKAVQSLAFGPDGHTLASGGWDSTVRLWNVDTQKQIGEPISGRFGAVYSVAFSPDGHTLATSTADKTVRLWDVDTHKQIGAPLSGHFGAVYSVAFSPDGHTLATGGYDSTARLWDVETQKQIGQPLHHRNSVDSVAFSPDGRTLVTGDDTNTVRLWDVRTHAPLGKPLLGHKDNVASIAFSPGGQELATGDYQGAVRLWEGFMWDHRSPETALADLQARVCSLVANLTPEEWQQFVPGLPYRTTCPG